MELITNEELTFTLNNVLLNRICVQSWLGAYNNLFLGFGHEILPNPTIIGIPGHKAKYIRPDPPCELQTEGYTWSISTPDIELSSDSVNSEDQAELAGLKLVGLSVTSWQFIRPGYGLRIDFSNTSCIMLTPDTINHTDCEWSVRDAQGLYWAVRKSGQLFNASGSDPEFIPK